MEKTAQQESLNIFPSKSETVHISKSNIENKEEESKKKKNEKEEKNCVQKYKYNIFIPVIILVIIYISMFLILELTNEKKKNENKNKRNAYINNNNNIINKEINIIYECDKIIELLFETHQENETVKIIYPRFAKKYNIYLNDTKIILDKNGYIVINEIGEHKVIVNFEDRFPIFKEMFKDCVRLKKLLNIDLKSNEEIFDISEMFSGCVELISANLSSINLNDENNENINVFKNIESDPIVYVNEKFVNIIIKSQMGIKFIGAPNYGKEGGYIKAIVDNSDPYSVSFEIYYYDIDENLIIYINGKKLEIDRYGYYSYSFAPGKKYYLSFFTKIKRNSFPIFLNKIPKIVKIDMEHINYEKLDNMDYFFRYCDDLKEVYMNNIYAPKLKSLHGLFYYDSKLEKVEINNFTAPNLNSLDFMFANCYSIKSLNLSTFRIGDLKSMSSIFVYCTNLKEVISPIEWNVTYLDSISYMFYGCNSIEKIDLSFLDLSNVFNVDEFIGQCYMLKYLYIQEYGHLDFELENEYTVDSTFYGVQKGLIICIDEEENSQLASLFKEKDYIISCNGTYFD